MRHLLLSPAALLARPLIPSPHRRLDLGGPTCGAESEMQTYNRHPSGPRVSYVLTIRSSQPVAQPIGG
jgi:hypothetical protein